nr:RNA-binding protein [Cytophagales bacterium]
AQFSPVYGLQVTDFDQDGNLDILAVQNDYATEPLAGWYDAGIGVCLRGDGKGSFVPMHPNQSGFFADGDAKALARLSLVSGQQLWLVTQNQGELKLFANRKSAKPSAETHLRPDDAYAEVKLANGKTRRQEFYYGEGYLSQSARTLSVPVGATILGIFNSRGQRREAAPTRIASH